MAGLAIVLVDSSDVFGSVLAALHLDFADALLVLIELISEHFGTQVLLLQHKIDLVLARIQVTE